MMPQKNAPDSTTAKTYGPLCQGFSILRFRMKGLTICDDYKAIIVLKLSLDMHPLCILETFPNTMLQWSNYNMKRNRSPRVSSSWLLIFEG